MEQVDKQLKKGNNIALTIGIGLMLLLIVLWLLI